MNILSVTFEDGGIFINWSEERERNRYGGEIHQTYVTPEGVNTDTQLQYWIAEIADDCTELLAAYQKLAGRPEA